MCWNCGTRSDIVNMPISRSAQCPYCGKDLRSCRNCRHYDSTKSSMCREPNSDFVQDKERSNFCDWFSLNTEASANMAGGTQKAHEARDAFSALFGD